MIVYVCMKIRFKTRTI